MLDGFRKQIEEWRAEAERARIRQENPGYARGLEVAADDFERLLNELANRSGTIAECVKISGISRSTLYRLMGDRAENVGEPGAPRLRLFDLPFAPGKLRDLLLGRRDTLTPPAPPAPSEKRPQRRSAVGADKPTSARLPRKPLQVG